MSEIEYDFVKYGLGNDNTFKCSMCELIFQCFTSEADTSFCPGCGSRSTEFQDYNGEVKK